MVSELFLDAEANLAFAEFDLAETALEDQAEVVTELLLNAEDSVPQKIRRLGSNNPNVQQLAGDVENDLTKLMLQAEVALDAAEAALSAEVEQAKDAIGSAQELLSAEATEFEKQECSGEDTETESA